MRRIRMQSWILIAVISAVASAIFAGCKRGPELVPVSGKVTYKGQPLKHGNILFQPSAGPPAKGEIGPDGSFTLSTLKNNDGAVIGKHRVQVICTAPPAKPANPDEETPSAKSLIPEKYSNYATSEITVEVVKGGGPYLIELK